jgi:HD superfamily phosphohydrolase
MGEIRDPIHVFVRFRPDEEKIIGSRAFQRLRYIHQLALTYMVYPGATHRRFEHCLGVMEIASRIYDVVTNPQNIYHNSIREFVPRAKNDNRGHEYWGQVLRCAALCHDLGHLPFSHAAENLLPTGWDHERLSQEIIMGEEFAPLWKELKIQAEDVAKLALGPKKCKLQFSDWETILSEIIVGDVFGADRIDYLLRDSYHAGVSYGRFDHYRLIDTLRILPASTKDSQEPELGIERGGLESAEALLWARYFMYTQLYFHPTRRIYDIHLMEFLRDWLPEHHFPTDVDKHFNYSDNEVTAAMWSAAVDSAQRSHGLARRIILREHFRQVYEPSSSDQKILDPGKKVFDALIEKFGADRVRRDVYAQKGASYNFPVYTKAEEIDSSLALSKTLSQVPTFSVDRVYVHLEVRDEAARWVAKEREKIIFAKSGEEHSNGTPSESRNSA